MGLVAAGVNAIKLKDGDFVVGASIIQKKMKWLDFNGRASQAHSCGGIPCPGRYGQGVISWKLPGNDQVAAQIVGS